MRTFTLEDLKKKKYQFTDENNQPLTNENGETVKDIQSYIQVMTKRITDRRIENAKSVIEAKRIIDKDAQETIDKLNVIKEKIKIFADVQHLTKETAKGVKSSCIQIIDLIKSYQKDIDVLNERISHGKIRIASVGLARQGKTTFTRLFTGLDEDILPSMTGQTDTTGTVVVLNHVKDLTEPTFEASYYTKTEILKTVNDYIERIRENRPNWTIKGKTQINSIDELRELRGCDNEIENINNITTEAGNTVDISLINGLAPYFRTPAEGETDWITLLTDKKEGRQPLNNLEDMRKHILMNETTSVQNSKPNVEQKTLYLAVREVHINIAFKRNGDLFNLVEFVDTKGGGDKAGEHVNHEIKNAIDMSDAVFSIHKTTTDNYDFNRKLSRSYDLNSGLKDKHFIIINEVVTLDQNKDIEINNDVETVKRELAKWDQAEIAYSGDLVSPDNAQNFANQIIADMLYHIAKHVNEFDNDRITRCNKAVETINKGIKDLCDILSQHPFPRFNEDDAVKNQVISMVNKAKTFIQTKLDEAEKMNEEKDAQEIENDYAQLKEQGKIITSLFSLVTGKKDDKMEASNKNCKAESEKYEKLYDDEPDDVEKELIYAISDIFPKIKSSIEFTPNDEHVGAYIEDCVSLLNRHMVDRINDLTKQQRIGEDARDEIFNELWKIFKLNICYSNEKNWGNCGIEKENEDFKRLHDVYEDAIYTSQEMPPRLLTPYKILRDYLRIDEDEEETSGNLIEQVTICALLAHALKESKLSETIVNISNKDRRALEDIAVKVNNCLKGDKFIANSCHTFYDKHKELILSDEEKKKMKLSASWKHLDEAKKYLQEPFKTLPLLV